MTPEGRVKVLDFGSPTLTMRDTVAGVILGTASYMSPDRARGQEVGRPADIWAFGVVL